MKRLLIVLLATTLFCTPVQAQKVGIDFESMKVGTKLTTTSMGYVQETYIEEYIGKENGNYLIQNYKLQDDGSIKALNKASYDQEGRLVSSTLDGKKNTYVPYSCHYVIGQCSHTYTYYNWQTKKHVTNEGKFENRLQGDTLFIGVIKSDGTMFEIPFVLGPHRLRLSSEHEDALGTTTGHKFVDLELP